MTLSRKQKAELSKWYFSSLNNGYSRDQLISQLRYQQISEADIKSVTHKISVLFFIGVAIAVLCIALLSYVTYYGFEVKKDISEFQNNYVTSKESVTQIMFAQTYVDRLLKSHNMSNYDSRVARINNLSSVIMIPFDSEKKFKAIFYDCDFIKLYCSNISYVDQNSFESFLINKYGVINVNKLIGIYFDSEGILVLDNYQISADYIVELFEEHGLFSESKSIPESFENIVDVALINMYSELNSYEPVFTLDDNYFVLGSRVLFQSDPFDIENKIIALSSLYAELGNILFFKGILKFESEYVNYHSISAVNTTNFPVGVNGNDNSDICSRYTYLLSDSAAQECDARLKLAIKQTRESVTSLLLSQLNKSAVTPKEKIILLRLQMISDFNNRGTCRIATSISSQHFDIKCASDYAVQHQMPSLCNSNRSCLELYYSKSNDSFLCAGIYSELFGYLCPKYAETDSSE